VPICANPQICTCPVCPATAPAIPTAIAVPDGQRRPTLDLAAVVEQSPLLACSLIEAALHAATAYSAHTVVPVAAMLLPLLWGV
jgi:hypothetical protein